MLWPAETKNHISYCTVALVPRSFRTFAVLINGWQAPDGSLCLRLLRILSEPECDEAPAHELHNHRNRIIVRPDASKFLIVGRGCPGQASPNCLGHLDVAEAFETRQPLMKAEGTCQMQRKEPAKSDVRSVSAIRLRENRSPKGSVYPQS